MSKYFQILNQGGFFMYPILLCSIIGLAITVERAFFLFFKLRLNSKEFVSKIAHAVEGGHVQRALDYCNQYLYHPLAKVLSAGLLKGNRGDKEIQGAMEGAYLEAAPVIQKRTGALSMLANVSTLLGLLGTIQGLIMAFRGVTAADAALKQEILAKGIAVAMFTTFFGLVVAIPCLVAYYMLVNRQNLILDSIQFGANQVMNVVSASNRESRTATLKRVAGTEQGRRS
ncbi:MAG: MotA/TolQ/ExbB proton channel family protein [Pseudomonadota bacterium]